MIIFVGRPNVGKSTLFNRLVGGRKAVISSIPGTTIDRREGIVLWNGKSFLISDLAGLPLSSKDPNSADIEQQAIIGSEKAEHILFILDAKDGWQSDDRLLLNWIRSTNRPYSVVVNKVDHPVDKQKGISSDIERNCGDAKAIYWLSSQHGTGINDLLDYCLKISHQVDQTPNKSIAIVGRPNVGKSTLFNQLLKKDRSVISALPGTTRDPIKESVSFGNVKLALIDTAGVRKKSRIENVIEHQAVGAALASIREADGIIVVLDITQGPSRQDVHIIEYAQQHKKPIMILVNKIDLVELNAKNKRLSMNQQIKTIVVQRFPFLNKLSILGGSALKGENLSGLISWMQQL